MRPMSSGSVVSPPISSVARVQAEASDLEPRELAEGQSNAAPKARFRGVQDQAEEDVSKALLDKAPVGRLSSDRDPNLLARRGDVETSVDQLTEAGRDITISMGEGVGEERGDRVGGIIDDARVALELVTKPVIAIGQESPGSM